MRLRILHVTPYSEAAWAYGGIPRIVGAMTRGLAERGHAVTVCTTDVQDEAHRLARNPEHASSVAHVVFPNLSNRLAYRQQAFLPIGLRRYLRRHARDFDVAHLHACRNLPTAIAAHYLRVAGVPYVIQPNGTAPVIERHQVAKRVFDLVAGRRIMTGAKRVVAVSDAEKRQLTELGVLPPAVRVIGNPIDLHEFSRPVESGAFRRRWGIGREPLVLFLGKITPRKNVSTLVRAFAGVDDAFARLVIAGNDMGGGEEARALAGALAISDRTLSTGLLSGRERLEALADADVVVYASEHEIFGLVPFESLLTGTPVIVADDSGCGDMFVATGGGLVVRVNDVGALARAINEVLRQPGLWRERAGGASRLVREQYGHDVVCTALENVYQELAA